MPGKTIYQIFMLNYVLMNKIVPKYSSNNGANVEYENCSKTIPICQLFRLSIVFYMSFLWSYAILLYPSSMRRKCPLSMLEDVHCQNIYLLKGVVSIFFLTLWITGVFQIRFTFNTGHLGFTEGNPVAIVHVTRYRIAAPLAYWQNMLFDLWTVILSACLAIRNLL